MSSPKPPTITTDAIAHIKVYSYYEIDHSKLSIKTPHHQLNFIRVVMVTEKSKANHVSIRFPSINAVRAYFDDGEKIPALDEKYTITDPKVAGEALYRRIQSNEFSLRRNQWGFWTTMVLGFGVISNKKLGLCWSELEAGSSNGMVKWGRRRQVRYLGRHSVNKITSHEPESESEEALYNVKVEEPQIIRDNNNKQMVDCDDDEDEFEEEEEEEEEEVKEEFKQLMVINKIRKLSDGSGSRRNPKRQKNLVVYNNNRKKHKKKTIKTSIDRWSVTRYKTAEESMLKILKEKGAVFGNPILRSALRSEARRLIGDTGLLDHLLKHMAGKVAPGGKERFMRRHNSEGAMEYWLENANLVDIRKEAGVEDPYWTPPPGWKPGDNPTQDPVCANQIKDLKQDVARIMRDLQELMSNSTQRELVVATTPNSCVTDQNRELGSLLPSLKEMYIDLMTRKSKIEEKMQEIALSLIEMEEGAGMLKSIVNNQKPVRFLLEPETPLAGSERETKELEQKKKDVIAEGNRSEKKAERIQKLKSGFRICKPHGSFVWPPNMAITTPPSDSPSAARNSIINLNEVPPSNQNEDVPSPITYQRRLHNVITIITSPHEKEDVSEGEVSEEMASNTEQERKWLALAAPTSSMDTTKCTRG